MGGGGCPEPSRPAPILADLDFDPTRDVEVAENRAWRWVDPEGRIVRAVSDYFLARHEDGRPPPGESATSGSPQS